MRRGWYTYHDEVTTIPKQKFKFELKNCIFKLSILRSSLLRLIYDKKYDTMDKSISDGTIGTQNEKEKQQKHI